MVETCVTWQGSTTYSECATYIYLISTNKLYYTLSFNPNDVLFHDIDIHQFIKLLSGINKVFERTVLKRFSRLRIPRISSTTNNLDFIYTPEQYYSTLKKYLLTN